MVRYCVDDLLGPQSHAAATAMRDLGFSLANLNTEDSVPVSCWGMLPQRQRERQLLIPGVPVADLY